MCVWGGVPVWNDYQQYLRDHISQNKLQRYQASHPCSIHKGERVWHLKIANHHWTRFIPIWLWIRPLEPWTLSPILFNKPFVCMSAKLCVCVCLCDYVRMYGCVGVLSAIICECVCVCSQNSSHPPSLKCNQSRSVTLGTIISADLWHQCCLSLLAVTSLGRVIICLFCEYCTTAHQ